MRPRQREACASSGMRAMERGVEAGHLRQCRAPARAGRDRRQVVRLVQRRQRHERLERGQRSRRRRAPAPRTPRRRAPRDARRRRARRPRGLRAGSASRYRDASSWSERALSPSCVRRASCHWGVVARRTARGVVSPSTWPRSSSASAASPAAKSENLRLDEPALRTRSRRSSRSVRGAVARSTRRRSALCAVARCPPRAALRRAAAAACATRGAYRQQRAQLGGEPALALLEPRLRLGSIREVACARRRSAAVRRSLGSDRFARSGSNSTTIVSSCRSRRRSSSDRCAISPSGERSSRVFCICDSRRRPLPALLISIAMRARPSTALPSSSVSSTSRTAGIERGSNLPLRRISSRSSAICSDIMLPYTWKNAASALASRRSR